MENEKGGSKQIDRLIGRVCYTVEIEATWQ